MKISILDDGIQIRLDGHRVDSTTHFAFKSLKFQSIENGYFLQTSMKEYELCKLIDLLCEFNIDYSLDLDAKRVLDDTENERTLLSEAIDRLSKSSFELTLDLRDFLSKNIKRKLKPFQEASLMHHLNAINPANFSVPGSGKTSVVLSYYYLLRFQGKVNTLLVVGPLSSFTPWEAEYSNTFGVKPNCVRLAGGSCKNRKNEYLPSSNSIPDILLTTYNSVLNDKDAAYTFLNLSYINAMLVIDEAHNIKQLNGAWAQALKELSVSAKYRCVLTGTPIPRLPSDAFNLFDFLWPRVRLLSEPEKARIVGYEKSNDSDSAIQLLKHKVEKHFIRIKKSDLGLVQPVFNHIQVVMNKIESELYHAIVKNILDYPLDKYKRNIELVDRLRKARIMRLRQSVSYSRLLASAIEDNDAELENALFSSELAQYINDYDNLEIPSKLAYLIDSVSERRRQGEKLIIWSNFIATIRLISNELSRHGFVNEVIYGETPKQEEAEVWEESREGIIERFINSTELNVLVLNPAACSESISLHKTCFHAYYYDLSYNCAQYLQSLDRIHRVGGSEKVAPTYHILRYQNTIDDDICTNLSKKISVMNQLLDDDLPSLSLDMSYNPSDDIEAYKRIFEGRS